MQSILNKASRHLWFERGENRDRVNVVQRQVDIKTKNKIDATDLLFGVFCFDLFCLVFNFRFFSLSFLPVFATNHRNMEPTRQDNATTVFQENFSESSQGQPATFGLRGQKPKIERSSQKGKWFVSKSQTIVILRGLRMFHCYFQFSRRQCNKSIGNLFWCFILHVLDGNGRYKLVTNGIRLSTKLALSQKRGRCIISLRYQP